MLIRRLNKKNVIVCLLAVFVFTSVKAETNEILKSKCIGFKKSLYEENVTFSYFHTEAKEQVYLVDHCKSVHGFVVGGLNALPKEYPFVARLGNIDSSKTVRWFCGGTLISSLYVLTAAHCFYSTLGTVNTVRLGELDFSSRFDDAEPEDFKVRKLIEHPKYEYGIPYNDIGLVLLTSSVEFNRYKHPACLPVQNNAEVAKYLIAIGWGDTNFGGGENSAHLKKVALRPYSHRNCSWIAEGPEGRDLFPSGLKSTQICAGSSEVKDTCNGDSGGPLLMHHQQYSCMQFVVGITSMGVSGCGIPNVPAVYTRVYSYLNWIKKYIEFN